MALGFAVVILAIATPIALIGRGVHVAVSWLAGFAGESSATMEAIVAIVSVAGTVAVTGVSIALLVGFFRWRRRFRDRVISRARFAPTRLDRHEVREAA